MKRLVTLTSQRSYVTKHVPNGHECRVEQLRVADLVRMAPLTERGGLEQREIAPDVESSVPQRTIEAVQAAVRSQGFDVQIGGQLFSDAMGDPGTPEGSYTGMVRHNIDTIVSALLGNG